MWVYHPHSSFCVLAKNNSIGLTNKWSVPRTSHLVTLLYSSYHSLKVSYFQIYLIYFLIHYTGLVIHDLAHHLTIFFTSHQLHNRQQWYLFFTHHACIGIEMFAPNVLFTHVWGIVVFHYVCEEITK